MQQLVTICDYDLNNNIIDSVTVYTVPKNPCEPRITKSIFSLKESKSFGKLRGKQRTSEQVETVGSLSSLVNSTAPTVSPNPRGGTESKPVKKTKMSCSVGEA